MVEVDRREKSTASGAGSPQSEENTPRASSKRSQNDRPERATPPPALEGLAAAIAALPAKDASSGSAVIPGVVRDDAGDPIAGVTLRARLTKARARTKAKTGEDLVSRVERFARETRYELDTTQTTTTGPDGAYELTTLQDDGRYDVDAKKTGWTFKTAPGHHRNDEPTGKAIDFVGTQTVELTFNLMLSSGEEPLRKSYVQWKEGSSNRRANKTWKPDDRTLVLPVGSYTFTAFAGDQSEYLAEEQSVTLEPGESGRTLDFTLKGRPGIHGNLTFADGEAPENAIVRLARPSGSEAGDRKRIMEGDSDWAHRQNGHAYSFQDVKPGEWLVGVTLQHGSSRILALERVSVTNELVKLDLEIPALDKSDYLVLWVHGPDGKAINDGVSVSCEVKSATGSSSNGIEEIKRSDGSLWCTLGENVEEAGPDAEITLNVSTQKFGTRSKKIERDQSEVTIEFVEPAFLDVTINGYAGSGHEGLLKLALSKSDSRHHWGTSPRDNSIDENGAQTLGPREPGDYKLLLQIERKRHQSKTLSSTDVSLTSGKNSIEIDIPQLHTLTVRTPGLTKGSRVMIRSASGERSFNSNDSRVDENERIVFEELAPGEYVLQTFGPKFGQMNVTVPAGGEVVFEPVEPNSLAVEVTSDDGVLAKSGFRDGDIIVSIDGNEFEGMIQMQSAIMGAMAKTEPSKMGVLRGGRTIELELQISKIQDPSTMGGDIEPHTR